MPGRVARANAQEHARRKHLHQYRDRAAAEIRLGEVVTVAV